MAVGDSDRRLSIFFQKIRDGHFISVQSNDYVDRNVFAQLSVDLSTVRYVSESTYRDQNPALGTRRKRHPLQPRGRNTGNRVPRTRKHSALLRTTYNANPSRKIY